MESTPVPAQNAPEQREIVYILPNDRRYTQARGNKVQRYTADGKTLLKTYPGFVEASRDPEVDSPVSAIIRGASRNKTVYKGFRWAELPRDADDNTVQDIGATVTLPTQKKGLVAMISLDQTYIVQVFCDQREAYESRGFKSCSPISTAIKEGTPTSGHYFKMWFDCSDDLKEDYLARVGSLPQPRVRSNGTQIQQVHPITNEVIATFSSAAHVIKDFRMSRRTLFQAIDGNYAVKGFYWRYV